ncbi:hypothetical protein [Cupriavidus sp. D39]|uniref:hypothetical protein n=1 Tax=Cupriavidus sp. D39 TaxID=2997877 RepID=UPI002270E908|nr:hypothetical protein [Cupriavidus sp. D39]MCY0858642.1 hypothetical protein [Cupriavidus sp. D39]
MHKTFRDKDGNLVEVVSVVIAPLAGGDSLALTWDAFSDQCTPAEDRAYRRVQVTLEEPAELSLPAYSNGTRWNSWLVPELPLSSIRQLAQLIPDVVEVDDAGTAFVRDGEDVIPVATTEIEVGGERILTYCIEGWCWELATTT